MSGIARVGTGEEPAEGTGAEAYMVDVDVSFSSFPTSSADDSDDRVQYAGGFVSAVFGYLSSSKKVGIGNGSRNCSPPICGEPHPPPTKT